MKSARFADERSGVRFFFFNYSSWYARKDKSHQTTRAPRNWWNYSEMIALRYPRNPNVRVGRPSVVFNKNYIVSVGTGKFVEKNNSADDNIFRRYLHSCSGLRVKWERCITILIHDKSRTENLKPSKYMLFNTQSIPKIYLRDMHFRNKNKIISIYILYFI